MECGRDGCDVCAGNTCSCSPSTSTSGRTSSSSAWWRTKVCCKCKEAPAQVAANQTEVLCSSCLNASLFSKFKTAINTHELIQSSDKVLLAFSGGPSSRIALEYLLEIREKAQRDARHHADGSAKVFGLGVAFVDESSILPLSLSDSQTLNEELRAIVMEGTKKPDEYFCLPLDSVYSEFELDVAGGATGAIEIRRNEQLQMLLRTISDPTVKEDLLEHLRMQALQQAAKKRGYTRLVLGLSTSRIAAKVISGTAKGCGFSLPAEMQYFDGRWNVPVILPLRDCVAKELALLCHFQNFKCMFIPSLLTMSIPQKTINSLSASFVALLQEENPSRERTIMRTAAKLQPFSFNQSPSYKSSKLHKRSMRLDGVGLEEVDDVAEPLCPVCCAPFDPQNSGGTVLCFQSTEPDRAQEGFPEGHTVPSSKLTPTFMEECCPSCQFQVLGEKGHEKMHELLPQLMKGLESINPKMKELWMRSQISDSLLSDSDSEGENGHDR